jgi:hypothetical protein
MKHDKEDIGGKPGKPCHSIAKFHYSFSPFNMRLLAVPPRTVTERGARHSEASLIGNRDWHEPHTNLEKLR